VAVLWWKVPICYWCLNGEKKVLWYGIIGRHLLYLYHGIRSRNNYNDFAFFRLLFSTEPQHHHALSCERIDFPAGNAEHCVTPGGMAKNNEQTATTAVTRRREIYNANFQNPSGGRSILVAAVNERSENTAFRTRRVETCPRTTSQLRRPPQRYTRHGDGDEKRTMQYM